MLRLRCLAALLLFCFFVGCTPSAPQIIIIPTLASLPSETPDLLNSPTPTLTFTPRPTLSPTVNVLETQVALLSVTLNVFLTQNAALTQTAAPVPTLTPSAAPELELPNASLVPSATITSTLPPTDAPPEVTPVLAQAVYVTRLANLRECASRECAPVLQIEPGNALLVTGTMQGDAITPGNALWFRVDHFGQILFVYSELVSATPPTAAPATLAPPPIVPTAAESFGLALPPVSVPQGGGSCPSTSATCGQLTCEQAYACLAAGNGRLDADDDGIPCESVCLGS